MTDKEMIEEMAIDLEEEFVLCGTLSTCGTKRCSRCFSKYLYEQGYRKIPEGSVVLPKKLYEQYTNEFNNYEVGKRDGSKETAREILEKFSKCRDYEEIDTTIVGCQTFSVGRWNNETVLISIQPKWVELIASGKKTIEVRKTRPKIETPFKCYIYCSIGNGVKGDYLVPSGIQCGKVIGEFVCDEIEPLNEYELFYGMDEISNSRIEEYSCVDIDELLRYKGKKDLIYGWHISNLKIYDKPKELGEFYSIDESGSDCCVGCIYHETPLEEMPCNSCTGERKYLYRPPQSWCYVEGKNER